MLHFLNTFDAPNEIEIVDLNEIEIPEDENEFTRIIYSIWMNDIEFK
jgi:hypothetical protein